MTAVVLVDACNVLRSQWPNLPEHELVELCRAWAAARGLRVLMVFDGNAPEEAADVVGSGSESADDRLIREAARLRNAGERFWLVTSDRALRAVAGKEAKRVVGGGSFLRELQQ